MQQKKKCYKFFTKTLAEREDKKRAKTVYSGKLKHKKLKVIAKSDLKGLKKKNKK